MPRRTDRSSIRAIGAGLIAIGEACELNHLELLDAWQFEKFEGFLT